MVIIKGLNKTCLVDFEPYTACVVFLAGCNFRCGYCHNPDVVFNNDKTSIDESEFFSFLESRKGWLDGVVITGGEPTSYKDLPIFIKKIKDSGFLVKLDTNGSNPEMIKMLIHDKILDYIAMDIKTDLESYSNVCGVNVDINKIRQSIDIIKSSGVAYEFRSTMVPGLISQDSLIKIGEFLKGSKRYVLQNFREKMDMIENRFKNIKPYKTEEMQKFKEIVKPYFEEVSIR
jgi:pyruvate formate lyase activating enzyme